MKQLSLFFTLIIAMFLSGCDQISNTEDQANVLNWPPNDECDLHQGSCSLKYGDESIQVTISPNNPIPVARLLDVEVKTENLSVSKVEFDIAGVNMYMGYNRTELPATNPNHNHFKGKSMLAFCTNDYMKWQLTVLLYLKDGQIVQAPFMLTTVIN